MVLANSGVDISSSKYDSDTIMSVHKFPTRASLVLLLIAHLVCTNDTEAQSMANFESSKLVVSGGEETAKNNSATVYHGFINITDKGSISGVLSRREFGATQTNSVSKPVTINSGSSKIFGTVIKLGGDTQTQTNSDGKTITTSTLYAADFHIATSLSGFMVKGRAVQQVTKSVLEHTGGGRLFKTTNQEIDVSLQGISMAPGGMRGFLNAD